MASFGQEKNANFSASPAALGEHFIGGAECLNLQGVEAVDRNNSLSPVDSEWLSNEIIGAGPEDGGPADKRLFPYR